MAVEEIPKVYLKPGEAYYGLQDMKDNDKLFDSYKLTSDKQINKFLKQIKIEKLGKKGNSYIYIRPEKKY